MGKGKSFKTDKEFTKERELSYKNKQLQSEINKMRKTLDKLKYGWCPKCIGEEGSKKDKSCEPPKVKNRTCYDCGKADLIMVKYSKFDGTWYYRACPVCSKRTRGKRLTPEVEEK